MVEWAIFAVKRLPNVVLIPPDMNSPLFRIRFFVLVCEFVCICRFFNGRVLSLVPRLDQFLDSDRHIIRFEGKHAPTAYITTPGDRSDHTPFFLL
jgi:hypothetical protein